MKQEEQSNFHKHLKDTMDMYVHLVYKLTRKFPREELYGVISQLRRASLSIILNYIEGYARKRDKIHKNFLEISYGSLQESKYLLEFPFKEDYLSNDEYITVLKLADEIGAMLWSTITKLKII